MLLSSALAPSLVLPLLAALSERTSNLRDREADAELFRRIKVAERLRNEHARSRRLRDRLREARERRPAFPPSYFRERYPVAWRDYFETFERYAAAVRAAVEVPADTVTGIHAKLTLAVIAARRGGARVYMYEDREWLEAALADLRRLAEGDRGAGEMPAGDRARDGLAPA